MDPITKDDLKKALSYLKASKSGTVEDLVRRLKKIVCNEAGVAEKTRRQNVVSAGEENVKTVHVSDSFPSQTQSQPQSQSQSQVLSQPQSQALSQPQLQSQSQSQSQSQTSRNSVRRQNAMNTSASRKMTNKSPPRNGSPKFQLISTGQAIPSSDLFRRLDVAFQNSSMRQRLKPGLEDVAYGDVPVIDLKENAMSYLQKQAPGVKGKLVYFGYLYTEDMFVFGYNIDNNRNLKSYLLYAIVDSQVGTVETKMMIQFAQTFFAGAQFDGYKFLLNSRNGHLYTMMHHGDQLSKIEAKMARQKRWWQFWARS